MDVFTAIEEGTGRKSAALLAAVGQPLTEAQAAYVVACCHDDETRRARGGAWVVRTLLEKGRGQGLDLPRAFSALESASDWVVTFHLLQSIRYAPEVGALHEARVRSFLDHPRTALRVGSLDAFVHLAMLDARLADEARARVLAGGRDDMPSIRSRARRLAKELARIRR